MKINPINPFDKIQAVKKSSSVDRESAVGADIEDKVFISSESKAIERAVQAAKNADVDRIDRINELKASIADGTYSVDPEKLADKILDAHLRPDGSR